MAAIHAEPRAAAPTIVAIIELAAAQACPYCGQPAESIRSCKLLCKRCRRVIGTCGD